MTRKHLLFDAEVPVIGALHLPDLGIARRVNLLHGPGLTPGP